MAELKRVHPVIVSVSRRTDIPAYHSEWLLETIKNNELIWKNPFNPNQQKIIRFEKTKLIVFWTKNPEPLINKLDFFNDRNINYYFQFTLNAYDNITEPDVPGLNKRIDLFKKIIDRSKKKNIIWRFDPIFLFEKIDEQYIYNAINDIGQKLKGYVERLMLSFFQPYPKVIKRLNKLNIIPIELDDEQKIAIYKNTGRIGKNLNLEVMSCSDPLNNNNELLLHGINKGSCIDKTYIQKTFPQDKVLMQHIHTIKKDTGQRKECGCIQSIDIGTYHTCGHNCVYCYAN